jgi:hypothetical protein
MPDDRPRMPKPKGCQNEECQNHGLKHSLRKTLGILGILDILREYQGVREREFWQGFQGCQDCQPSRDKPFLVPPGQCGGRIKPAASPLGIEKASWLTREERREIARGRGPFIGKLLLCLG